MRQPIPRWAIWYCQGWAMLFEHWKAALAVAPLLAVLAAIAWGSCTTIPVVPQTERRDAVCAALRLEPGCFIEPRRLVEGQLVTSETDVEVIIQRVSVGRFPMPPDAITADPAQCTDVAYVENLLRFHTGSPEIQDAIRRRFPAVHRGDVVFFDRLMGTPVSTPGVCTITADVMVARR